METGTIDKKIVNRQSHLKSKKIPHLTIDNEKKMYTFDKRSVRNRRIRKKIGFKRVRTAGDFDEMVTGWYSFLSCSEIEGGVLPKKELERQKFLFSMTNEVMADEVQDGSDPDNAFQDKYDM